MTNLTNDNLSLGSEGKTVESNRKELKKKMKKAEKADVPAVQKEIDAKDAEIKANDKKITDNKNQIENNQRVIKNLTATNEGMLETIIAKNRKEKKLTEADIEKKVTSYIEKSATALQKLIQENEKTKTTTTPEKK